MFNLVRLVLLVDFVQLRLSGNIDLFSAVKNAKTAFYKDKGKQKQVFRREARRNKRVEKKAKHHQFMLKKSGATVTEEV